MNTLGRRLRVHIFGESHGAGVGCTIDGIPAGTPVDVEHMQARLNQRRPGTGPLVSSRDEADEPTFLSGVYNGVATGAPLTLFIANQDTRSKDYDALKHLPRPGHADWPEHVWSRGHRDIRGGGHTSGRLTAPIVAAAAIAESMLAERGIRVGAHLHQVGHVEGPATAHDAATLQTRTAESPVHTAHAEVEAEMVAAVQSAREAKDSLGGTVTFRADGVPVAWGGPWADSVESLLAHGLFSIPAVKGVEFGAGFAATRLMGSQHNDPYRVADGVPTPATNHAGGVLGGRTTGAPVTGAVAIKPTSSIFQPQATVDLRTMQDATLELKGRHDPCIAIRAVPVVRAMVELVLADLMLLARQEGHA